MKESKKPPKVSCLLLNWNGIKFTKKCLKTLLKTTYTNFDIIVVDNGSEKNEAELLKKEFSRFSKIKIIRSEVNLGYAAGMNLAYKNSTGDYIMLLNNDMEFGEDWLSPLVEYLGNHKKVGAVQPKMNDMKKKGYFEHGGAAGGFFDIFGYPFARGRIFSSVEKDNGQYDNPIRIGWAGVILIKKSVLKKIGLFHTIYFNYGEDMDLCYKIYGAGYSIVNIPQSVVYHYGSAILGKNMQKKTFYHHRNSIIFLLINFRLTTLLYILLPRIILDVVSIFYYIVNGFPELGLSVIQAYMSLITRIPQIYKSRITNQKILQPENITKMPIYKGSIIWDYFIRRRKKFSELMNHESLTAINT